ncbi:ArsR/SmtB family transcription factor [Streptomyces meridianus]|uniref:Metalloregulator ArsR/SmtB family transcription factor n=1 Tax=Streptomyces meridianus TaxID=2938945 RepID=A0ABT0X2S2_9ACTN|nr:metalloregulator ArsR/SmtB family transcription factor [Streptomyces meridianus]MCM2576838.1 metalloregulator ArsR/SmtB family transcription factor [Streptomyces meridianus]
MGDPERKAALYDALARTGKALSNGKRLELLDLLAQGERSVDALARAAGLGVTTASAHLQTLKQAGLVVTRREGTRVHYRLAGDDVVALYGLLQQVARTHQAAADAARAAYLGPEDTDHLTRDELLERVKDGSVVVVDVRPAEEYAAGHIPGALSLPLGELEARLGELPADAEVVAYCRGANCVLAHDAVRLLGARGRRAKRLADGMLEWRLAALPVEPRAA